ncbi:hypothetical protein EW145_g3512 [Phellinidium pouzarii]|uniref:Uncharacterized protein n=1 Tax=Phellinidium pouzarii TaxID=167371 RepID=A0A4S4L763_9AGAM|nr:hypothetical protein EW145_g3512 [Phellinidium pouzarii]
MSSICVNGTLPGRPDIEGIGTRIATYLQLLLAIFTIAFSPGRSCFDSWWALLVTSLGLQFAAIAQRTSLTLFHALIVTWLAFPIFAMSWAYIFFHWREAAMPSEILLATHVHGFVFVGFGLWIWSSAPSFGACPDLNGSMQFVVLGKSVHPLGTYIPSRTAALMTVSIFNIIMLALSIWTVETLLIRNVTGMSRAEDSSWTFGQISALILLLGPLFTFARVVRSLIWSSHGTYGGNNQGNIFLRTGAPPELVDEKREKYNYSATS